MIFPRLSPRRKAREPDPHQANTVPAHKFTSMEIALEEIERQDREARERLVAFDLET
ncbi:MAG: hypothetical protein AAFQ38_14960 [Pseudomonadota bacterium]